MTIGIYGIFDSETNECLYVGQASNVEYRWKQHLKLLRSKKHPRKDFIEWYHLNGADSSILDFCVLEETNDTSHLNALEIKWFNELRPKYFGKQPSLNEAWRHSEDTKILIGKKVREAQLKALEKRNCPCGNDFETHSSSNKIYCSVKCGKKTRFKQLGKNQKRKIPVQSTHKCHFSICNNVFNRQEKKIEGKKYFCSYSCSSEYFYRSKGLTKKLVEKLVYEEKLSLREMAIKFNCSHQTIKNFMVKNNIKA